MSGRPDRGQLESCPVQTTLSERQRNYSTSLFFSTQRKGELFIGYPLLCNVGHTLEELSSLNQFFFLNKGDTQTVLTGFFHSTIL